MSLLIKFQVHVEMRFALKFRLDFNRNELRNCISYKKISTTLQYIYVGTSNAVYAGTGIKVALGGRIICLLHTSKSPAHTARYK